MLFRSTGFAGDPGAEFAGKRLQFLLEARPGLSSVAYLGSQTNWDGAAATEFRKAAEVVKIKSLHAKIEGAFTESSIRGALAPLLNRPGTGLILSSTRQLEPHARLVAELALIGRLAGCAQQTVHPKAGLLMSYGPDYEEAFRGAAGYIDRILKGEKPADLPVQLPMRFDLVINKKTADALGLEIPLGLWVQATEILE